MEGTADDRRVVRLVVDVLATPEQVHLLSTLVGDALCGLPDDHEGPCRVAWRIAHAVEGEAADGPVALAPADVAQVRAALGALEVLAPADALASLRAEVEAAHGGHQVVLPADGPGLRLNGGPTRS
ncbi:hypothetical protein [Kineosporia sp. R_H_3]|uniref:hypothetical protein n=1 Tax=Kineosporia sp. R_H_3 TaxID=1961848 RepID=UPI00117A0551|nr:hypothetical protein [Kineosporia sp. R_H_3]